MARRSVRRALLKSPKKDPQQELVYFWENHNFRALFYGPGLKLPEARALARTLAKYYRVPVPAVRCVRRGRKKWTAAQFDTSLEVNTDKATWTYALLCHEMAHWVMVKRRINGANHGPTWLGIYLNLLAKCRVLPLHASIFSARKHGLKFKNPLECRPEDL